MSTTTTTASDADLISAVRGGDVGAYGELFERHVEAARRLARQLVAAGDVDDLVSESFAKVLGVLQRGGGPDLAFRAYLLTSLRRAHVDRVRAGARLQTTDDLTPYDPGVPFQDTTVTGFENGAAARAFASLPERWQLVLWHTEVEGQKPAEVAPLLGMSPNSVAALAYRAREGLRQAFLSMHAQACDDDACGWARASLGAYVRGGTSRRDRTKVEAHLADCRPCAGIYLELTEVNSELGALLGPLVLGGAAAAYVGAASAVGTATASAAAGGVATGVLATLGRARDAVLGSAASGGGATAVGGAAGVAVAVTTAVVVSTGPTGPAATVPGRLDEPRATASAEAGLAAQLPAQAPERAAVLAVDADRAGQDGPVLDDGARAATGRDDGAGTAGDGSAGGAPAGPAADASGGADQAPGPQDPTAPAAPPATPPDQAGGDVTAAPGPGTGPQTAPSGDPSGPPPASPPKNAPPQAPGSPADPGPSSGPGAGQPTDRPSEAPSDAPPSSPAAPPEVTASVTGTRGAVHTVVVTVRNALTGSDQRLAVSSDRPAGGMGSDRRCQSTGPAQASCEVAPGSSTYEFSIVTPARGTTTLTASYAGRTVRLVLRAAVGEGPTG